MAIKYDPYGRFYGCQKTLDQPGHVSSGENSFDSTTVQTTKEKPALSFSKGNGEENFVNAKVPSANLISSLTVWGHHKPILDLDFPVKLVSSSTTGHSHLYVDGAPMLTTKQYQKLLTVLYEIGWIQKRWAEGNYMIHTGPFAAPEWATFVRIPDALKIITPE